MESPLHYFSGIKDPRIDRTKAHLLEDIIVLKGCIVTIDAMNCQKEITSAIISQEADYILALKGSG